MSNVDTPVCVCLFVFVVVVVVVVGGGGNSSLRAGGLRAFWMVVRRHS